MISTNKLSLGFTCRYDASAFLSVSPIFVLHLLALLLLARGGMLLLLLTGSLPFFRHLRVSRVRGRGASHCGRGGGRSGAGSRAVTGDVPPLRNGARGSRHRLGRHWRSLLSGRVWGGVRGWGGGLAGARVEFLALLCGELAGGPGLGLGVPSGIVG